MFSDFLDQLSHLSVLQLQLKISTQRLQLLGTPNGSGPFGREFPRQTLHARRLKSDDQMTISTSLKVTGRLYSVTQNEAILQQDFYPHILRTATGNCIVYEAQPSGDPDAYCGLELKVLAAGSYDHRLAASMKPREYNCRSYRLD